MKQLLFLLLFCMSLSSVSGWNWQTHTKLVEGVYYTLEGDVLQSLDTDALLNGSLAPDRDFHDNRLHHYPPSYNKTLYWLEETRKALREKRYTNASYSFGVANHYMSDSFAAPHNIEKESSKDHAAYEKQADQNYQYIPCDKITKKYDLHQKFLEATKQGKTWEEWLVKREGEAPTLTPA